MSFVTNQAGIVHAVPDEDLSIHLKCRTGIEGQTMRVSTDEEIEDWKALHVLENEGGPSPKEAAGKESEKTEESEKSE